MSTTPDAEVAGPPSNRRVDKRILLVAAVAVLVLAFVVPLLRRRLLTELGLPDEFPMA